MPESNSYLLPEAETKGPPSRSSSAVKALVLATLVVVIGIAWWQFGNQQTLNWLADRETTLRTYQADSPVVVYVVAFLVYVAVTGLSLPGAAVMTLAMGWYFGLWPAVVLVSFASTTGATLAFLLSRYLFRDAVERKHGDRFKKFFAVINREGAFYLFTLRLIPAVPFFLLNIVTGITKLPVWTFWWVSQLGMLPGTIVYCYAGSQIPRLTTLVEEGAEAVFTPARLTQIAIAFTLLGLFPLAMKKLITTFRQTQP